MSGPTAASSEATSFSCANVTPGQQRPERGALRGLAGRRQRAGGAPVERVLERDDPRLAGRLAGVLDRRLVRLGARVAEERLRAAEAPGELRGELAIGSVQ